MLYSLSWAFWAESWPLSVYASKLTANLVLCVGVACLFDLFSLRCPASAGHRMLMQRTSAVHKRARIESENNGVSEAAPIHPDCRPVEEPSSKDDEQAGNGKTLSSVSDKLKDSEIDKGKHRDRHEEDRRREDRRAHASKERYALSTRPTACAWWLTVHISDKLMPSACSGQAEDV